MLVTIFPRVFSSWKEVFKYGAKSLVISKQREVIPVTMVYFERRHVFIKAEKH